MRTLALILGTALLTSAPLALAETPIAAEAAAVTADGEPILLTKLPIPASCPAPTDEPEDWVGQKYWRALERAGYSFGKIQVTVGDIYEDESAWYAEGANFLHIDTHQRVVREHLVIAPGGPVVARKVYESLRALRNLGIFRSADVIPVACHDNVVDAVVQVNDAWTLILSLQANHVGGTTSAGIRVEDRNFLGTGKEVYVERAADANRTTTSYAYNDPALFGSRWHMGLLHSDQSDGKSDAFGLRMPFRSTDQVWAFDLEAADINQDETFYQDGLEAWKAPSSHQLTTATAWYLLALDKDQGWRLGFGARDETQTYDPLIAIDPSLRPAPTLNEFSSQGATISINRFHDDYANFNRMALVDHVEDYNLAFNATLTASLGATPRYDASASFAGRPTADSLLLWDMSAGARDASGQWQDGLFATSFTYYDQSFERQTLVARLGLDWRKQPDPENELSIGGDQGLLGYPAHYVVGDEAWKLHLEDRYYTDKVLFQTFKVGYSAIFEAGAARRIDTGIWSDTLADVGVGFRLGNLRGAYGQVLYFTVFKPLVSEPGIGSVQYVIGDIISF